MQCLLRLSTLLCLLSIYSLLDGALGIHRPEITTIYQQQQHEAAGVPRVPEQFPLAVLLSDGTGGGEYAGYVAYKLATLTDVHLPRESGWAISSVSTTTTQFGGAQIIVSTTPVIIPPTQTLVSSLLPLVSMFSWKEAELLLKWFFFL